MTHTEFAYKKVVERPRTTWLARAFVWVGNHALLSGFLGGICVVLFAMGSAIEGVKKAPTEALIISALVVGVWTVLIGFMGKFFARQGVAQLELHRAILAGDDLFRWREGAEVLVEIDAPTYTIRAATPPEKSPDARDATVFLTVTGAGGRFVLETKISADEARQYQQISPQELGQVDETLPIALASRVLLYGERNAPN